MTKTRNILKRTRAHVSCVLILLFTFGAPAALGATAEECQEYLRTNHARIQCGSTCVIHTLITLLEMHVQKPLSVEYALLSQVINRERGRIPSSLPARGARSWASALLSLGISGVQSEDAFLRRDNVHWWYELLGSAMSEESVLEFGPRVASLHAEPWWHAQELTGKNTWRALASRLSFRYVTSDFNAYFALQRYELQLRALGVHIRFWFRDRGEIESEMDESLNQHMPVGLILAPTPSTRHAEIALSRLPDRSVITRNTGLITRFHFWERPAPELRRSAREFRRKLVGALFVTEREF